MSATDPKGGESPVDYPRDVYPVRGAAKALRLQAEFERRIRIREVAAERARLTAGVYMGLDDTGFCPGGMI